MAKDKQLLLPTELPNLALEMDHMRAALSDGSDVSGLAHELIDRLSELGAPYDLVQMLRQGLAARQVLFELGLRI